MPQILFANNAGSTLAGSISGAAASANLASGAGALFPSPSGGDYFVATLIDAATGLVNEIVHVTARSGDTVTIVRGQEGTAARAWAPGDIFSMLITAGMFATLLQAQTAKIVTLAAGSSGNYTVQAGIYKLDAEQWAELATRRG